MRAMMLVLMAAGLSGPALACDRAVPLWAAEPAAVQAAEPAPDTGPRAQRQRCLSAADIEAVRTRFAERWVPLPPRRPDGV